MKEKTNTEKIIDLLYDASTLVTKALTIGEENKNIDKEFMNEIKKLDKKITDVKFYFIIKKINKHIRNFNNYDFDDFMDEMCGITPDTYNVEQMEIIYEDLTKKNMLRKATPEYICEHYSFIDKGNKQ